MSVVAFVALLFLHTCVFSCLSCGRWGRVFRHTEVSRRGKERETSSQKETSARPCAFRWAWGRLERSCAMMRSLRDTELRILAVAFSTQPSNTHNVFVLCRQLLSWVDKSFVFTWPMGVIVAVP